MTFDKEPIHLFDAYGVELEYMIVNKETCDVMPVADWLLVPSHRRLKKTGASVHTAIGQSGTAYVCAQCN